MNISKRTLEYSRQVGNEGESLFLQACSDRGLSFQKATQEQDMYQHIDCFVSDGAVSIAVDIKGAKKSVCLEFKNVRGNSGWLYGHASQIAFLSPDKTHFLLVPRIQLLKYAEKFLSAERRNTKEKYYLYTRNGRDDLMTFVDWTDLETITNTKKWEL